MSKKADKNAPLSNGPHRFFHVNYEGDIELFKSLLKKKIGFDFKDMGNFTIYVKVKKEDYETFCLFIQGLHEKGTKVKNYQEITEEVYTGALLSLDKMLHP